MLGDTFASAGDPRLTTAMRRCVMQHPRELRFLHSVAHASDYTTHAFAAWACLWHVSLGLTIGPSAARGGPCSVSFRTTLLFEVYTPPSVPHALRLLREPHELPHCSCKPMLPTLPTHLQTTPGLPTLFALPTSSVGCRVVSRVHSAHVRGSTTKQRSGTRLAPASRHPLISSPEQASGFCATRSAASACDVVERGG